MKKFLAGLIAVCLTLVLFTGIFGPMPSARADITEGYYTYTVDDSSNATITGYTGSGGIVVIPSMLGGCSVTSLGLDVNRQGAFCYCMALTSGNFPPLLPIPPPKAEITEGDYTYTVDDSSNATITDYTGAGGGDNYPRYAGRVSRN